MNRSRSKILIIIAPALLIAMAIGVPLAGFVAGMHGSLDRTSVRIPVLDHMWEEAYVSGWEYAGRDGKPRRGMSHEERRALIFGQSEDDVLVRAVQLREYAVLKEALDGTRSPDVISSNGRTPLTSAVIRDDLAACQILLGAGADPKLYDAKGASPMHYATSGEVMDLFIRAGVDIDVEDSLGRTPLYYAIMRCDELAVQSLVLRHADVHRVSRSGEGARDLVLRLSSGANAHDELIYSKILEIIQSESVDRTGDE